jgi:hypothetical protein
MNGPTSIQVEIRNLDTFEYVRKYGLANPTGSSLVTNLVETNANPGELLAGKLTAGGHYQFNFFTSSQVFSQGSPTTFYGAAVLTFAPADASTTPLPAAATAGLALFGGMGLRRRSRRAVAAA